MQNAKVKIYTKYSIVKLDERYTFKNLPIQTERTYYLDVSFKYLRLFFKGAEIIILLTSLPLQFIVNISLPTD